MLAYQQQFRFVSLEAAAGYQYRSFDDDYLGSINIVPWRLGVEFATEPEAISPLLPEERKKSYVKLMLAQDFNDQGLGESYFKANRITLDAGCRTSDVRSQRSDVGCRRSEVGGQRSDVGCQW